MVEWHPADRVLLQYGLVQNPLQEPDDMTRFHSITVQGQHDCNWERFHQESIAAWNDRRQLCVTGEPFYGAPTHSNKYMRWFTKNTKRFISDDPRLKDPRHHVDVADVDEEDEEDAPPQAPRTQTERRDLYLAKRQRASKNKKTPQGIHQTQDHVPHRHSISHPQTFEQNTPYPDNFHHTPPFHQNNPYPDNFHHTPPFQPHNPYPDNFHNTTPFQQQNSYPDHFHNTHPFQQQNPYPDHFHNTPSFQQHPHSTSQMDIDQQDPWFGQQYDSSSSFSYLAFLQQQVAGGSSSTVLEFNTEEPLNAPTEEEHQPREEHPPEEEHRPQNRRSKRVPKPKGCGTGGHLHH